MAMAVAGVLVACASILTIDDVGYAGAGLPDAAGDAMAADVDVPPGTPDGSDASFDATPVCTGDPPSVATDAGERYATCGAQTGVDLLQRADHCGRCDHACALALCVGGHCEPTTIGSVGSDDHTLLVDGAFVYWSSGYVVQRVPVPPSDAGPETVLVHDVPDGSDPFDERISAMVAAQDRFWIRTRVTLANVLRDGGDWHDVVNVGPVAPMALEPQSLAYVSGPQVLRYGFAGATTPVSDDSPMLPRGLVRTNGGLFWVTAPDEADSGGGQLKADEGGVRLVVSDAGRPYAIATDGTNVFWSDTLRGRIYGLAASGRLGDTPALVAEAPGFPEVSYLAVDSTHVYWFAKDPANGSYAHLLRRAKCGLGSVTVVRPEVYGPAALIAPDGPFLYAITGNLVVRIPK